MPAMNLTLGPPGRKAAVSKAKNRHTSPLAQEMRKRAEPAKKMEQGDLQLEFKLAAEMARKQAEDPSGKKPKKIDPFKPHDPDRGKGRRR